ncbi:MAG: tetratricopeptide repeat protein [Chloroflexota bacterium]
MTSRSVAVVPFGARSNEPRAGAWGRQLARRLVDRFAGHPELELRPVFLVAMPEDAGQPGYLVFGSTPDAALAAQYGSSLGATNALAGIFGADRTIEVTLVDVAAKRGIATFRQAFPEGTLHEAETALGDWLAGELGSAAPAAAAPAANETAYLALLEAMDEEVNATLLATNDPAAAAEARVRAVGRYLAAVTADPTAAVAEERLLVIAAESLERGDEERFVASLEDLCAIVPGSWRAHYLLGELRRVTGNTNGAVVALEHADSLHPLSDADSIRLAELDVDAGAEATARSRLRRIKPGSDEYAHAQDVIGVLAAQSGDLAAARIAFDRAVGSGTRNGALFARLAQVQAAQGDPEAAAATFAQATVRADPSWELWAAHAAWLHGNGELAGAIERYREAVGHGAPVDVHLGLARALVASDARDAAVVELDELLATEKEGEIAAHARRLRFGLQHHDLEERLERAGRAAVGGGEDVLAGARADAEAVLAAEPELWEAHFALGLIARRTDDGATAEKHFRRVLDFWPDQPDAVHELGVALLMAERTNEALRLLDQAAQLRPEDAGYLADAGFAQLRAGNLKAARERLARASELDATDPITLAYLKELARVETAAGRPN